MSLHRPEWEKCEMSRQKLQKDFKLLEDKSKRFEETLKIIKEHREHNSISYLFCYVFRCFRKITSQQNLAEVKVSPQDSNI
jgi:hypothetical protein